MSRPDDARSADPRARAAQTKRDRTRGALLDAAEAAFGSRGWAGTRMEDVALSAGVSPATAYNHFPSKHALVGHVFGALVRPLLVQAERDAAAGLCVHDALSDQVRALCRLGYRYRPLTAAFWSAVQEYAARVGAPPDAADDMDPRTLAPVPECFRPLVQRGQDTGVLRCFPDGREVSAIISNLLLIRSSNRPQESPETAAEVVLTMLFGMLDPELLAAAGPDARPFARGPAVPVAAD